jgi:Tannase and feruloyl esterase
MRINTLFLVLAMGAAGDAYSQNGCAELKDLKMEHAKVVSAEWFEAGLVKMPQGYPFGAPDAKAARHCQVNGVSRPTADSEIRFVLWLPAPEDWNGKYLQRGNGGWAGFLPLLELITPVSQGYAVAGTDDGHATKDGSPDASWAVGHRKSLSTSDIARCMKLPFNRKRSRALTTTSHWRAPILKAAPMGAEKP